ncbi:MAG TPA: MraY family glycosyltransferase [Pirellulaceae bacterium]|jgi:UDP-GlcNAc:undecaprenyl-phosphate GlcNAc-1-phosphate transferase|nr:MraY family glycosyltransferase [Pirellulaceae bacterium]
MDSRSVLLTWLVSGTLLPSAIVSCLAIYVLRAAAPKLGLMDHPDPRKVHVRAVPLGGGIGIWLGVIVPFAIGQLILSRLEQGQTELFGVLIPPSIAEHLSGIRERANSLWAILGAGTFFMALGLADDRFGLPWQARLASQFAVAALCVVWQGWQLTAFVMLPYVALALSIVWIVGMINSFNMLDNMDGLSSGVALIASASLAAVALTSDEPGNEGPQLFVGGFLLVLVGALAGFLWHNRPPAKIFMGDAGSYFVGFCVSVATLLATYTSYVSPKPHAILAPLVVMAVPLYDMTSVIWIRLRAGSSPFKADKNHLSHRLVELGMNKTIAVLTIYLLTAICGLSALLLQQVDALGAVVILLIVGSVLLLVALLEMAARRKERHRLRAESSSPTVQK